MQCETCCVCKQRLDREYGIIYRGRAYCGQQCFDFCNIPFSEYYKKYGTWQHLGKPDIEQTMERLTRVRALPQAIKQTNKASFEKRYKQEEPGITEEDRRFLASMHIKWEE